MVRAYILVKAHTGEADRLRDDIATIDGVEDVTIVAGDVDLIAKIDVESPAAVREVAATRIQGVSGVEDTKTYVALD